MPLLKFWTKEREDELISLFGKGLTQTEIGSLWGISRSQVGGKIRRLRAHGILPPVPGEKNTEKRKKQKPKPLTAQDFDLEWSLAKRRDKVIPTQTWKAHKTKTTQQDNIEPLSSGYPSGCQWPIGDPKSADFHFCLKPRDGPRSSYCLKHAEKSRERRD